MAGRHRTLQCGTTNSAARLSAQCGLARPAAGDVQIYPLYGLISAMTASASATCSLTLGVFTATISLNVQADPPDAQSRTVLGNTNIELSDGAHALQAGDYERGVELTLAGLDQPALERDRVAGLSNLCAGYVGLRKFELALVRCSQALELDPQNWRALNNRAAAWLGLGQPDAALQDLRRALAINPDATVLQRSLEIALSRANRPAGEAHNADG